MAAFSYQHYHPFLHDSVILPHTNPVKVSGFMEEENKNINISNLFSHFYPPKPFQDIPLDARLHETSCLDYSSKVALSDNGPSVTKKQSTDSSTVVDKLESGEQVTQTRPHMDHNKKNRDGSSPNSAQSKDVCEVKSKKQRKWKDTQKDEDRKHKAEKKEKKKLSDEQPPTGYIHVRARRGQATDSHSLAERVRREKISERMKILQKLVPGCDKVTGKALMLDEIINYVQSLQNQVEFLSMKLASLNPMLYDFGMDLEAFAGRPERLNAITSPMQSMPQCSPCPAQLTAFAASYTTPDNYPVDSAVASQLLQQGQRTTAFSQDNGGLFWDVEDQKQRFLNPYGFATNH